MPNLVRAQGYSLEQIRQKIKSEGFLRLCNIKSYAKSVLDNRLKNAFYGGYFSWEGIQYYGKHQLIIPRPILDKVRASFTPAFIPKPRNEDPLFTGMIRCATAECSKQVIYDPKQKTLKGSGQVLTFKYYHCSNSRKVHPTMTGMNVTEQSLLDQYRRAAKDISITAAFAEEIRQALKETDAKAREAYKRQAAEYLEKARNLGAMEDALYEHFCSGVIDKDQYKRNVAKIRHDRERYFSLHHQTELAIHESYADVADRLLEMAIDADSKYKVMTDVEKRDFIKEVCSNHLLDGQTVHYSLKNSFRVLVAMRGNEGWLLRQDSNLRHGD